MNTVKIVLREGFSIHIKNCKDFFWDRESKILVVEKNNGHKVIFNTDFVQCAGFLEDLKEGEADESMDRNNQTDRGCRNQIHE